MGIDRTIAIVGTDFCGSTLLSRLMWLCPGVAAVGEVHAYLRTKPRVYRGCDICGRECELLGGLNAKGLVAQNLYRRVAALFEMTKYHTLVLSDKSPVLYYKTTARWVAEPLVVFRSPEGHGTSEVKHNRRSYENGVKYWTEMYRELLYTHADAMFVDFEAFVLNIPKNLPKLCRKIGLPKPAEVPEDLREIEWHHVGGSRSGRKLTRVNIDRVLNVKRGKVSEESQQVLSQLRRKSVI